MNSDTGVYFITAFDDRAVENGEWMRGIKEAPRDDRGRVMYHRGSHDRTFGYFLDEKTALMAVRENWMDMHESLYTYIVVQKVPPGIHPIVEGYERGKLVNTWWFKWETSLQGWIEIDETPPAFTNIICYSIG